MPFADLTGRAELILVGGLGTRGIARYLESVLAQDEPRPDRAGDPLPHPSSCRRLRSSRVRSMGLPSHPWKRLACGVPVVVTRGHPAHEGARAGRRWMGTSYRREAA